MAANSPVRPPPQLSCCGSSGVPCILAHRRPLLPFLSQVELARGNDDRGRDRFNDRGGGFDRGGGYGDRGFDRRGPPPRREPLRRSDYKVVVSGMPDSCSWQDLKDHMRTAGSVNYADVSCGTWSKSTRLPTV